MLRYNECFLKKVHSSCVCSEKEKRKPVLECGIKVSILKMSTLKIQAALKGSTEPSFCCIYFCVNAQQMFSKPSC